MNNADNKTRTTAAHQRKSSEQSPAHAGERDGFFGAEKSEPFFQPKLTVNQPGDQYEQEADEVADEVVQRLAETPPSANNQESKNTNVQEAAPVQRTAITPIQPASAPAKTTASEDKEQLQKKDEETPEMPIERKPIFDIAGSGDGDDDDNSNIQRKPIFESEQSTLENPIQRSGSDAPAPAPASLSSQLQSSKGGGSPLPADVSSSMGEVMGADLSGVRVHTGSEAVGMSESIQAQAFTHGSDVYFNEGKYDTGSTEGKRLLAHELTHTVQQGGGGVQEKSENEINHEKIQRAEQPAIKPIKDATDIELEKQKKTTGNKGFLKKKGTSSYEIHIEGFEAKTYLKKKDVEMVKTAAGLDKIKLTKQSSEDRKKNPTKQIPIWKKAVKSDEKGNGGVKAVLLNNFFNKNGAEPEKETLFKLVLAKNETEGIIGTFKQILDMVLIPFWDEKGKPKLFDVEHMLDYQILGDDADRIENLMLWDKSKNRPAGGEVKKNLDSHIEAILTHYAKEFKVPTERSKVRSIDTYLDNFKFKRNDIPNTEWYEEEDLTSGAAYKKTIIEITDATIPKGHFLLKVTNGKAGYILPYSMTKPKQIGGWFIGTEESGGKLKSLSLIPAIEDNKGVLKPGDKEDGATVDVKKMSRGQTVAFEKEDKDHVYKVDAEKELKATFTKTLKEIQVSKASPIQWEEPQLEGFDVRAGARIASTLSIFEGVEISMRLDNGNFVIQGNVSLDQFTNKIPKPFKVDSCDLFISASSNEGLVAGGGIEFSLGSFGTGAVFAKVGKSITLGGEFNFNSKYFNPAAINFSYSDGKWSIGGEIGIKEGQIKGVKSATLKANYSEGVFSAAGKAFLSIPGLNTIDLAAQFDDKGNFQFMADATLGKIPGVKSGAVKVIVSSKEGGDIKVGMQGKVVPDLPNVPQLNAELTVSYNDGVFLLKADVAYKKGKVGGKLTVGVTNQATDAKGNPVGEPNVKGDTVIFGYGELSVDIIKDNKGNAKLGVRLTPAGDVLVSGQVSLQQIRPFGEGKSWHKDLPPQINIKIPLIGIPGLSVYLAIGGGPYFDFRWDPLVLKEFTITFPETNINQLETAALAVKGSIGSMARAEAGVFIKASLGAQVLIANLEGSLIGSAGLALEAEAGGEISADWSLEKGLVMKEIVAKLSITPKAVISLKGQIRIYLDLWLTTVDLYTKTWTLAEGAADLSGFTLNVSFPMRFDENNNVIPPEDTSTLDVQQPDFGGKDGDAILDSVINGDAKREREAKKMELRAKIKTDMRNSVNDSEFSPSVYAEKLVKKYKDDAEMRQFIMEAVEEEVKTLEYEEFQRLKDKLRFLEMPIPSKMMIVRLFALFRKRIAEIDIMLFQSELENIEIEKKKAEEARKHMAAAPPPAPVPTEIKNKVRTAKANPEKGLKSTKSQHKEKKNWKKQTIQRKEATGPSGNNAPDSTNVPSYSPATDNQPAAKQNDVFSRQLNASKGEGTPLPLETSTDMGTAIGADFSKVRIHTNKEAAEMNRQVNAQAFTHGSDIYFNEDKYNPSSKEGKHLLVHELTHTVQQNAENSEPGKKKIQRFAQGKTTIEKKKDGTSKYKGGTGHAAMTEEALHAMGLNPDQARKGRLGNWERDLSQALTPGTVSLLTAEGIMPMLQILAIKEFGRGVKLEEFGTYDPVEHIDNPAGLRGSDVFKQVPDKSGTSQALTHPSNPDIGKTAILSGTEGPKNVGYANVDSRYAATSTKGKIHNLQDAKAFQIDESTLPRYMNTSKQWLTGTLREAAMYGRKGKDDLGPRKFSSGIHTMQDFYAHSNFCEIGINLLIKEGNLEIATQDENKKIYFTPKGNQRLDTHIHAIKPDETIDQKNLAYPNGLNKNGQLQEREAMITGSFNLTDTAASILEEVADILKEMNPFDSAKKGHSKLLMACFDYIEMNPENPADFTMLGKRIAQIIRNAKPKIEALTTKTDNTIKKAGIVTGKVVETGTDIVSRGLEIMDEINESLGGSSDYFGKEQKTIKNVGSQTSGKIQHSTQNLAEIIKSITLRLDEIANKTENEAHILRGIYVWLYENNPLKKLKERVKEIPVIGEALYYIVNELQDKIKQFLENTIGWLWNQTVTFMVQKMNKVIAIIRSRTNVQHKKTKSSEGMPGKLGGLQDMYDQNGIPINGIAPSSYAPPSHTEIAKDHDNIKNSAKDQKKDDQDQGLDHDYDDGDYDKNPDKDEHGHTHVSNYLAPLAAKLGKKSSIEIGRRVASCWDEVDQGREPSEIYLNEINKIVDEYFCHPADCNYWQEIFKTELKKPYFGTLVKKELDKQISTK